MSIKKIRPIKPIDRMQNIKTVRPIGKTKWVKAHWRYDYRTSKWEWVLGHWSKQRQTANKENSNFPGDFDPDDSPPKA